MFLRKYLAFVETTFPWIFCCFLSWWVDRLFVEFGHRATDTPICTHSDLQYVFWHQIVTTVAVVAQVVYSVTTRRKQFKRELSIVGVFAYEPCLFHIYLVQTGLCVAWSVVIACLIDVSPWLCIEHVLKNRATIAAMALVSIFGGLVLERRLWTWTLNRALAMDPDTIDI